MVIDGRAMMQGGNVVANKNEYAGMSFFFHGNTAFSAKGLERGDPLPFSIDVTKNPMWIDLDAMMRPNDQALAYAATWIRCDAPREVALRFGSDEALAVWVNGTEMLRKDVIRRGGFDQDVVGASLQKGWNRILVKVGDTTREWGFRMRVTDAEGAPLTDLAVPASEEEVKSAAESKETSAAAAKASSERIPAAW